MGQESSAPIDENTPPNVLRSRNIDGIAEYIKSGKAKKVVFMTGAGISTSAGIPDFRSPDTGLYANLAKLNLPFAEAVFDISYFRGNPTPFYTLAHELYPGKYRPTIAHSFISLLNDKDRLLKCFTQNIDCLEREAGVPDDKMVEAHGSFAKQRCIDCKTEFSDDLMKKFVMNKDIPHCQVPECNGLVKPDIVFFGEQLPPSFFENRSLPGEADLCIVMGTSLTVQPFASLPRMCDERCPRVLINKERVGDLGSRPDDVLLLGDIDENVKKLADAFGLGDELRAKWQSTRPKDAFEMKETEKIEAEKNEPTIDEQVDKLSNEIDETLQLSREHSERTIDYMEFQMSPKRKQQVRKEVFSGDDKTLHVDSKGASHGLAHVFPHFGRDGKPKDEKL